MTFGVLMLCCQSRTRKETRRKPAALTGCLSRELGAVAKAQSCAGETHKARHNRRKWVIRNGVGAEKCQRVLQRLMPEF